MGRNRGWRTERKGERIPTLVEPWLPQDVAEFFLKYQTSFEISLNSRNVVIWTVAIHHGISKSSNPKSRIFYPRYKFISSFKFSIFN